MTARVLVVDHVCSNITLLGTRLASNIPKCWRRPTAAIGICERGGCYIVLLDVKMPGMDGLAVIREAKRYKADLPVIIITGFSTESSAIEAVNLGVAGYLTKPFRVPQVLAAAAKALGE